jgi:citrate lyase subunit beta/citryl-CoA lyase
MITQDYLLRTLLFVPGHNDKLIESASKSEADALVFDLEDSVMPFERKEDARNNIKIKISELNFNGKPIFVRVNESASGVLLKDLHTLTIEGINGFLYPKTNKGSDIFFIDKLLETIEYEKKFPIGTFKIIPIIEGTAAVLNAQEICQASKRVIALAFGSADFMTDLKGLLDDERISIQTPRALIALAARANNVLPIDTSFNNVHDLEGLEYNLKIAKKLGFEGMSVLHPKQIELAHRYFSPSEEEYKYALELLRLNDLSIAESRGVSIKEGKFIGPPLVEQSKQIIKKWNLIHNINK